MPFLKAGKLEERFCPQPFVRVPMAIFFDIHSYLPLFFLFLISLFFVGLFYGKVRQQKNLPPGPPARSIVGNLLHLGFSVEKFEVAVKKFYEKYGPIFTIWLGSRPLIMIGDQQLAHEALIQKGSVFADRPPANWTQKLFNSNQHNISSAAYGSLWRTLRRNLVSEALSPSAVKAFGEGRKWAIERLVADLRDEAAQNGGRVLVAEKFRSTVFCILFYMCFGTKPDEATVSNVLMVMKQVLRSGLVLDEFFMIPSFFLRRRRARMAELRRRQQEALLPLIRKRRDGPLGTGGAYIDSLLALTVESGRSLNDGELVTLCSEFINAGTDTTWNTLQWTMANLVIRQDVQTRLYDEIIGVVGTERRPVGEDDVQRMPFLDAVVKETLRRHPPGHFVIPHAVTGPSQVAGFDLPAGTIVNFDVAGIGMDPRVWQNPSEFRPERFADDGVEVDLTGSKEIKMMPFGAGRRVCPGIGLAMLHMHLIVTRLVQEFSWKCKPGETVDLCEGREFTVVMKYPLQAIVKERSPCIHI